MANATSDLHHLTISEAGSLIKARELSPVDLTQAFLDRIDALDGDLNSYVTLLRDEALAQAKSAEAEISSGQYRGPLHGIPMAHKDLYDTKGIRTTGQSLVHEHRVPAEDATVIRLLGEAGSILLGKLAMYEFAMGGTKTSLFEQAKNPWNTDRVTSGSSSGSGAAVAAGLAMGSLGSDTGGSIRGPASWCGIVGLKPTYGLVSRYGVLPISWSLDHCGPMTWTVEDTALMLQAIAVHDPNDPASASVPAPNYADSLIEDVKGLVIGVPEDYCFGSDSGMESETAGLVKKAISDLESLGARVENVTIPSLEYATIANNVIILSEGFNYHLPNLKTQPQNYGEAFISKLYLGALFTSIDYVQAQRVRSKMRREFDKIMEKVDLIVTPTGHGPPTTEEEFVSGSFLHSPNLMAPFNQTGMPAISTPCGLTTEGLPVGLQIAGRAFDEATVLRAAYTYQQHAGHYKRRPLP